MEHGLLQDAGHDGAVDAAGVGRIQRLRRGRAVLVFDDAPAALQAGEEGIHLCHVALAQAQLAELGEDELLEPVRVDVGGRVLAPRGDLAQVDRHRVTEPGLGPEDLGAFAALGAELVLEGEPGCGARLPGTLDLAGHPVESTHSAARDPAAVVGCDADRTVLAEGEGWPSHREGLLERSPRGFRGIWSPESQQARGLSP
ncbi:hypothetical protein [Pseudonocardia sp. 73-21]|uniref:hypothetical protein n=1 Tax=Pseudonocardia sp. 73-21 TaxID=1895809 RepID=UPI00262CAD52|nr:hypothetical protein [Pseudonocardia sp. 73-21]